MSAENYDLALKKVLVYEGGYSNDKGDPGGATMWGITHIDYDAFRSLRGLPRQDVRKMTREERDAIYKKKYWTGSRCDELPAGVEFVVFDCSVNSGCSQSIKFLQRAVGTTADGHIGDRTLAALHRPGIDYDAVIRSMCDQRRRFLRALKHYSTFKGGWERRVNDVQRVALSLSAKYHNHDEEEPHIDVATNGGAKAPPTEIATAPLSTATASSTTVGATVAASAVQQAQDALGPYSDALTALKYVVIGLAVIGAILTVYSLWKNHKAGADA